MPHVTVNIGGRPYRLACGEGEEAHLEHLAGMVEAKIEAFRGSFGEIGDQRIAVMAAISLADELVEAERNIAALRHEAVALKMAGQHHQTSSEGWIHAVTESLGQVSQRIEAATAALKSGSKG